MHIPDKPKKPLTPYFRFLRDYRQDKIKSNPEVKATELVKMGAADWAKAHASIKDKYTNEYKQDLEEYTVKMTAYNAKLTPEQQESIKEIRRLKTASKLKREIKKKSRDLHKPKRPLGPYMQFLMEKSKDEKENMVVLMQKYKGQFQLLPDAVKQKYVQLFEDDRKRYELQMKEWEQRMIAEGHEDLVRHASQPRTPHSRLSAVVKPKKQ